jgi:hypothetical protein
MMSNPQRRDPRCPRGLLVALAFAPTIVVSAGDAPCSAGVPPPACNSFGANEVAAFADTCISTVHACETVDVVFTRADATPMRGYSVRFHLSPNLALCDVPGTSITKGPYLTSGAGMNGTVYQVVSHGGNAYTVDEAILGTPCGALGSGVLFRVRVGSSGGDGVGTIAVDSVTARDCSNGPIAGVPGAPGSIGIDNTRAAAIADLAATQIRAGNDADGTTKIRLTFTPPAGVAAVQVYRAGFGNHPEYDDPPSPGSVPATPGYPPPSPWALTAVTASGQTDEVATRDFWYFVAFAVDSCGNVSPASNQTTGTLNYNLGDVHNGISSCTGNNLVNTSDISFLGAHYAITLVASDPLACLDIGPTTDSFVHGRPTTDNRVQFEDLILFAINFGDVSKPVVHAAPLLRDEITVLLPEDAAPGGDELLARIWMRGSGRVQGVSVQLGWNSAAVEPLGIDPGDLMRDQQGVVFGAGPGGVDAALLGGRERGLVGEGVLATAHFRVVGPGDPNITVALVDARDPRNERVEVRSDGRHDGTAAPRVTQLLPNLPNPFNPSTRIAFTLAEPGRVDVGIYSAAGRRVRALVADVRGAGLHEVVWDGTDDAGVRLASGAYRVRLATRAGTRSRPVVMLK